MQNKAVIVGALGVIGRYIVEKLIGEAIGSSRIIAKKGRRTVHATDILPSIFLTLKKRNENSLN